MGFGSCYILICRAERLGRFLVTLAMLPVLVLSPLTAQAILIHDHHGHDTHSHTLSVHELDEVRRNAEHRHEEHEHDGPGFEPADSEGSLLVILLDLPEGLARGRVLSSSAAVAGSHPGPSTNVVTIVTQQCDRSYTARPSSLAQPVRDLLEGILLTSHALLL